MTKKKFILCLGNQKCGTTWLFSYLAASQNYASGFAKEYHVFDYKDLKSQRRKIKKSSPIMGEIRQLEKFSRLRLMRNTDWYYFHYFSKLLTGPKTVTGDITPSYSSLTSDRLKMIDRYFSELNIEVVPVVLFRDPFTRIKSSVQMNFKTGKCNVGFDTRQHDFDTALLEYHRSEHCKIRTSYKESLSEALNAFGERLGVFFYEDLFNEKSVRRLAKLCSVELKLDRINQRINPSKNVFIHTNETEDIIRSHFADQYVYFNLHFPQTKTLWTRQPTHKTRSTA